MPIVFVNMSVQNNSRRGTVPVSSKSLMKIFMVARFYTEADWYLAKLYFVLAAGSVSDRFHRVDPKTRRLRSGLPLGNTILTLAAYWKILKDCV